MEIAAILVKGEGDKTYLVHVNTEGSLSCTCPDQFYRSQDDPDHRCKHIRFAASVIVLSAATPV